MPTGYTHELATNGQSFPDFVKTCARAFGALILLRDLPLSADIPTDQKPDDYYFTSLATAEQELARWNAMTTEEKLNKLRADHEESKQQTFEHRLSVLAENARLATMADKVRAWTPPSKDHQGLKDFMLQQIETSMNGTDHWEPVVFKEEGAIEEKTERLESRVARAKKSLEEELERVNERNRWVRLLVESLNYSEASA